MGVTVDIEVAPSGFPLGRILEGVPDVDVELDRVVPRGTAETMPLLLVEGDYDEFERRVGADDAVRDLRLLDRFDGGRLYRIEWATSSGGLLEAVVAADAIIVDGRKRDGQWSLRLRFHGQANVDAFTAHCEEHGVDIAPLRVYGDSSDSTLESALTPEQSATLRLAFERSYFDIPRGTTLCELATELGVSDQAVSERLRRAIQTLLERELGRG